jgi:hypothetical protein
MEKTLIIDGKEVKFKSTGATALRYKAQFHRDYLKDILKLGSIAEIDTKKEFGIEELEKIDFEVFYNIAWSLAKTADPSIGDPIAWLDGFDEFPLMEIIPELQEFILTTLNTKKK